MYILLVRFYCNSAKVAHRAVHGARSTLRIHRLRSSPFIAADEKENRGAADCSLWPPAVLGARLMPVLGDSRGETVGVVRRRSV